MTKPSEDAFRACFQATSGRVRGFLLRRGAGDLADDLAAEVFAIAWRRWREVPDEPLPWLLRTARNCLANARRSERRRASLIEGLPRPDPVDQTLESAARAERMAEVLAALDRLSAPDRELLLLVAWEGLTSAGAAEVMGWTAVTARVRLHRARRRLTALLDPSLTTTPEVLDAVS